jgi:5-methylcytosine-specific restriction endonuclease McrA
MNRIVIKRRVDVVAEVNLLLTEHRRLAKDLNARRALYIAERIWHLEAAPENLDCITAREWRQLKANADRSPFIRLAVRIYSQYRRQLRKHREHIAHVLTERGIVKAHYARLFVAVGRRDGFWCAQCHKPSKDLQLDHVIPVSAGGLSVLENLQLLCAACNSAKGASCG